MRSLTSLTSSKGCGAWWLSISGTSYHIPELHDPIDWVSWSGTVVGDTDTCRKTCSDGSAGGKNFDGASVGDTFMGNSACGVLVKSVHGFVFGFIPLETTGWGSMSITPSTLCWFLAFFLIVFAVVLERYCRNKASRKRDPILK